MHSFMIWQPHLLKVCCSLIGAVGMVIIILEKFHMQLQVVRGFDYFCCYQADVVNYSMWHDLRESAGLVVHL